MTFGKGIKINITCWLGLYIVCDVIFSSAYKNVQFMAMLAYNTYLK